MKALPRQADLAAAAVGCQRGAVVVGVRERGARRRREHTAAARTEPLPRETLADPPAALRNIEETDRHVDGDYGGSVGIRQRLGEARVETRRGRSHLLEVEPNADPTALAAIEPEDAAEWRNHRRSRLREALLERLAAQIRQGEHEHRGH